MQTSPKTSHSAKANQIKAGLTAFFNIMKAWGINDRESKILLGKIKHDRFYRFKKGKTGNLSEDELDRLSYIVGIYKALGILVSAKNSKLWLGNKNEEPLFKGYSPLEYMLTGKIESLADVRRYLDAARG